MDWKKLMVRKVSNSGRGKFLSKGAHEGIEMESCLEEHPIMNATVTSNSLRRKSHSFINSI